MKTILSFGLAAASLAAFLGHAQAAQTCGRHDDIAGVLGKNYHENRQAIGLSGTASLIELFVSKRGTWTMTLTNTQGVTCVIGTGDNWQHEPMQVAGVES